MKSSDGLNSIVGSQSERPDSQMRVCETPIEDLYEVKGHSHADSRGFLRRLFCVTQLEPIIGNRRIVQVNHTLTKKLGTVRGLHFQRPPQAEMKLVSCIKGEVFDVAVDLRAGSPTFLQWHAIVLSETNHATFVIPEGFAHGFQALTTDCELVYFHTADYNPETEGGLDATDPRLSIHWPKPITQRSPKDMSYQSIQTAFLGLHL